MDLANPLGMTYRIVKEVTYEGKPARIVSGSATFETVLEDLWDAVTNPERIPHWFLPITGDLRPGGRYQLEGHAGGEISRCKPPEAFDATWECGGNVSWLRVRLDAHGGGARLTLEHIMPKDEASEEHWRKYGPGATGVGWDLSFLGLSLNLRTGNPIVQDEFNAALGTEDGKSFIRECAAAWADAHINAGADEALARSVAQQTARFYCGE